MTAQALAQTAPYGEESYFSATAQACRTISERTGVKVCALSGGVFQNKLLLKMVKCRLEKMGLRVLIHSLVPANDGGIALGQAFYLNEE